MFVHRCNPRCVYLKEIQPDRAKYRGIWGILMHKMIFPSERCNSISKGTFHELRPFSVIAENRWPYNTNTFLANLNLPKLSEEVSLNMGTPITEIRDAI